MEPSPGYGVGHGVSEGERSVTGPESQLQEALRKIPAVQTVMRSLPDDLGVAPIWVQKAVREVLETIRRAVVDGNAVPPLSVIHQRVRDRAAQLATPNLRPVINATGVMIHTNLGRAPLPDAMMGHLNDIATHYSTLEYRLDAGARGSRHDLVADALAELTGGQAAMVVNNNAAAVLLALSTMAAGREVVVSRGELVEIGGSFRIPEVMALSGVHLVEVGATNKTHIDDYERAITENTALLLKVHQSNFRQVGFVESVARADLVALGIRHGIPVMEDLGSGVLLPLTIEGHREPQVQEVVQDGVAVATFSGDKLLGGPQAGLIVGQKNWIERMKKNPMARAVRVDKMTLAVLELVLRWYREDRGRDLPLWRMIYMPLERIVQRSEALVAALRQRVPGVHVDIEADWSEVGGGSMPGTRLETRVIAVDLSAEWLASVEASLRAASHPVVARVSRGKLLLDLRTVFDEEETRLLNTLVSALMTTQSG